MIKVTLGTVMEFDSKEQLINTIIDAIKSEELMEEHSTDIPEDWENPESWNEDSIYVFMQTCGKYVYEQVYDYDDIFLDGVRETPVTIQY
jgi:hypothetical protein